MTNLALNPHQRGAFRQGLRDLGYVEGRNLVIEYRDAEGKPERLPALARDLARLKIEVIMAPTNPSITAAKAATTTIPIVMVSADDPVGQGYIASLARPGGNITGLTAAPGAEMVGKRFELLAECLPGLSRLAVLVDPKYPGYQAYWLAAETGAVARGIAVRAFEVRDVDALEGTFAIVVKEQTQALLVLATPFTFVQRGQIAKLALRHRLPTSFAWREGPEAGGLLSYGFNVKDSWRRAAVYVDKILKGAKPADLPVEQPTKFELVINLKTAKALGLMIPPSLLGRADEVIR